MAKYKQHFDKALEMFCTSYSPCQYRDRVGGATRVNSSAMHQKGHQNARGKTIRSGPYISSFTFEAYYDKWIENLSQDVEIAKKRLNKIATFPIRIFQTKSSCYVSIAPNLHISII